MIVLYFAGLILSLAGCFLTVWKRSLNGLLLAAGGSLASALGYFFEGSLAMGTTLTALAVAALIVWAWAVRDEAA